MIRILLQFGHCEDTVYAVSVFSGILTNRLHDVEEGCALAHTALALMKNYNSSQLIPRWYGILCGRVLVSKEPIQSLLDPLLGVPAVLPERVLRGLREHHRLHRPVVAGGEERAFAVERAEHVHPTLCEYWSV